MAPAHGRVASSSMEASLASRPAAGAASQAAGGLVGYRPIEGVHDEMVNAAGMVRPHWRVLHDMLKNCGAPVLRSRQETIARLLLDHGATYNVYQDAKGASRPWALDVLPVIIAADEWRKVAAALSQRARLFNLILADLYGPQRLLADGWIPPAVVFANSGYLRAAHGSSQAAPRFLTSMGTDLLRGSDGAWMVLADRTQAPSGMGYSLENRIVMSSVMPEEFGACGVQRLATFFDIEREALRMLAPSRRGTPSVVMLTPGPWNETYFEHAFKARYLGFPLVEGGDLTVRGRRVHLKTLDGLGRVDVIVRRVDDVFCDPLEMRADTTLGVPGLAEAWRSGNVALVNAPGAGVVETPALHPFLPGLCRHLLGEELAMRCAPTWWCGQHRELEMVLANPERWVLKRAFVQGSRQPVFMAELDAKRRTEMIAQVRSEPHAWVAQELLELSTTPVWIGDQAQPRSVVWRTFTVVAGDACHVMPGGLSRVSADPNRFVITMQSGGISKDTWVIADGPVDTFSLLPAPSAVLRPARPPGGVPSRVADHLYWLGRYAERLEQMVRVLRATLIRLAGERSDLQEAELHACASLLAKLPVIPAPRGTRQADVAWLRQTVHALATDADHKDGILDLLSRLRFNASAARERLSDDMWRLFNRLENIASMKPSRTLVVPDVLGMLDSVVLSLGAFAGMAMENMTRGHGWRFLEIGRRVERALSMLEIAAAGVEVFTENESVLTPLLEIGDSSMTYRRLHFASPRLEPVLDLLLLNDSNPRSVTFQLQALARHCAPLIQGSTSADGGREKELADEMLSSLSSLNLAGVGAADAAARVLPAFCRNLQERLEELSEILSGHYFSHSASRER